MSDKSSIDILLEQAREREKGYDWLGAVEFYRKALDAVPEIDFLKMGQIQERIGFAFYRAAMQAESVDEFRDRMSQAKANYDEARELYGRLDETARAPWMLRCDAMVAYIGYWLASKVPEKKRLLGDCWRLTMDSLKAFKEADDAWEYGMTFNQLSSSVVLGFSLEWDFQAREELMKEVVGYGEQAIKFLSALEDKSELARAYARTSYYLGVFDYYFLEPDERVRDSQRVQNYWRKAIELSEETTLLELLYPVFGAQIILWGDATDEAVASLEKALEYGRRTRDRFIIGCALDWLTYHSGFKTHTIEDPEERSRFFKTVLQYAEDAKKQYATISFTSPRADAFWVEWMDIEHYWFLAVNEMDVSKKRGLLEKAMEAAIDALERAEPSECPYVIMYVNHVFSLILAALAFRETNSLKKRSLLEEALKRRKEANRILEQVGPFHQWDRGMHLVNLGGVKYQLADLNRDSQIKRSMIEESLADSENGLRLAIKGISSIKVGLGYVRNLGGTQYNVGTRLNRLYELTNDKENLRRAAKAFADAAESYQKVGLKSRVAECHWKVAQTYHALGEHLKAAENFDLASGNYKGASEKIPQLKDLYQDHAEYMQAWNEVEKAQYHHETQEYGLAEDHYEKAAILHKSLKQWSYLAPNYSAWAQVEKAEDLSRKEQSEESIRAFGEASRLFTETKELLQAQLAKIENLDEKHMVTNIVNTSGPRREYCIGRIALEEAKILDKKGDHYSSSREYGSAAETFEKALSALESEQDQKEFQLVVTLSRAWQKMMLAEARASPELYMEASQLFEQASDHSSSEKASFLTLGHSRFCRALEAGTRLIDTRDAALHTAIVQHLGSAADYYIRAGFQSASEYAKATKLLFDAYVHIGNAERETDPEKKAKLYAMAERVLQTSAGSFMKAEHPEKREQVLSLLEKTKEERELAISLTEVLHAPTIISTTTAFSAPMPTKENAVGLDRFDYADIQANVITRQKELRVGDNLDLEIELVNAGKGPAHLIKLAEVVPEGFDLKEKPEIYRVEDNFLNMKGKRLDPLKTEEVKLILKPKVQGAFEFKPKILYLDENGKYKSHEPDPITITVKELGVKGWIKGER